MKTVRNRSLRCDRCAGYTIIPDRRRSQRRDGERSAPDGSTTLSSGRLFVSEPGPSVGRLTPTSIESEVRPILERGRRSDGYSDEPLATVDHAALSDRQVRSYGTVDDHSVDGGPHSADNRRDLACKGWNGRRQRRPVREGKRLSPSLRCDERWNGVDPGRETIAA